MNSENTDEISAKGIIKKLRSDFSYLKSKWLVILIAGILGGALGVVFSIVKKPIYTSSSTFVVEEGGKSGGLGQLSGLASIAGIDLGGGNSAGGIFQSDNILELYKSRLMIEKALLSTATFNDKKQLLIERYIEFNKLRAVWKEKDDIDNISFTGDPNNFNRKQDSIISDLVKKFNKNVLTVVKPDKKTSIIKVDVVNKDELFAREFNLKLVANVNSFYVQTKTKKSDLNVRTLQHQADSVKNVLNISINGVASAIDAAPNANPSLQILKVPSQRKQVDVQASTAIYAEIVKNLEITKMSLRQETPLIQSIDSPVLPLSVDKVTKTMGLVIGIFAGGFIVVLVLTIKKAFSKILEND